MYTNVPLGVASYTLPRATTYDDRIATRAAHITPEYKGGDRKGQTWRYIGRERSHTSDSYSFRPILFILKTRLSRKKETFPQIC